MPNAEHSLRGICELIDQPLAAVDGTSSSNILCGNQLFCDLLGVSCEAIENCSVFDLPDGSWNGSQLKQLLAEEHNFSTGEVQTLLASSRVASTGEKDLQVHVLPFSADGRKVFMLKL